MGSYLKLLEALPFQLVSQVPGTPGQADMERWVLYREIQKLRQSDGTAAQCKVAAKSESWCNSALQGPTTQDLRALYVCEAPQSTVK